MSHRTINHCQGCGDADLLAILDYGQMPLVNKLELPGSAIDDLALPGSACDDVYPLHLCRCQRCGLVQIKEIVDPTTLFGQDYPYFSSTSPSFVAHAKDLVDKIMEHRRVQERPLGSHNLVVEIASNDGYLLQHFKALGVPVLGVEPSTATAEAAELKGIPTDIRFFNSETAAFLCHHHGSADVILGLNVLAHVDNIHGFLGGVWTLLNNNGLAVFEFPYLLKLLQGLAFDTVYHEHLRYYSLTTIIYLLALHGLYIYDAEETPVHGGSLRIWVSKGFTTWQDEQARRRLEHLWIAEDNMYGRDGQAVWTGFTDKVEAACACMRSHLKGLKDSGKRVAVYGASAKGTVLMHYAQVIPYLNYVVDKSVHKQGRRIPGTHLEIYSPAVLLENMPDAVLLTPWNFADEIIGEQREYLERGGTFIIPLPEIRTVTKEDL